MGHAGGAAPPAGGGVCSVEIIVNLCGIPRRWHKKRNHFALAVLLQCLLKLPIGMAISAFWLQFLLLFGYIGS